MYRNLIKRITDFGSLFHMDETEKLQNLDFFLFFFFFASIQNIFIHIPLENFLWGEKMYIFIYS